MQKFIISILILVISTTSGFAQCYGTDTYSTCYDYNSGNSYSINRFGDSTYMNGWNSNTGSTWSQNSRTFGDTTYMNGYSSDGGYWSSTITPYGIFGYDSDGNYFNSYLIEFLKLYYAKGIYR